MVSSSGESHHEVFWSNIGALILALSEVGSQYRFLTKAMIGSDISGSFKLLY